MTWRQSTEGRSTEDSSATSKGLGFRVRLRSLPMFQCLDLIDSTCMQEEQKNSVTWQRSGYCRGLNKCQYYGSRFLVYISFRVLQKDLNIMLVV